MNVLLKSSKHINHHCVLSKKCPYDKPEWQEHCDLDEKPPGLLPAYQEALPLATALHSFTVTVGSGSFLHSPRLCVSSSLPCSLVFGFPSMHVPVQASPIRLCAVGGQKQDLLNPVSLKLFKHK